MRAAFGPGWQVRGQGPLAVDEESEPEPDVAVVRGSFRDYLAAHPSRPVLVVEVGDLSDAVRVAANQGKCFDTAMKEVRLPKYEKWGNYDAYLPGNIERSCEYWGRGY